MITVQSPINKLGYGYVGYNFTKRMNCYIYPMGNVELDTVEEEYVDKLKLRHFNPLNPTLKIYHQYSLFERVGNGPYFAFPIFELDTLTEQERYSVKTPNELIVCSKWAQEVLVNNDVFKRIYVVNLGIDETIFNKDNIEQKKNDKYVFFNAGKWETRKGHDVLIEAFLNAFTIKDNVELWMMCSNPFLTQEESNAWIEKYTNHKLWSKVKILPRVNTQAEIAAIIKRVDCGVFPARAEGWGMEGLECLACGKELITTNYAGHTEYATDENAHLIEFRYLEPAVGVSKTEKTWFTGQGNWGSFDIQAKNDLVDKMKYCYVNRPTKNQASYDKFRWSVVAERLEGIINRQI